MTTETTLDVLPEEEKATKKSTQTTLEEVKQVTQPAAEEKAVKPVQEKPVVKAEKTPVESKKAPVKAEVKQEAQPEKKADAAPEVTAKKAVEPKQTATEAKQVPVHFMTLLLLARVSQGLLLLIK